MEEKGKTILRCDLSLIAWCGDLGYAGGSWTLALGWVVVTLAASACTSLPLLSSLKRLTSFYHSFPGHKTR